MGAMYIYSIPPLGARFFKPQVKRKHWCNFKLSKLDDWLTSSGLYRFIGRVETYSSSFIITLKIGFVLQI